MENNVGETVERDLQQTVFEDTVDYAAGASRKHTGIRNKRCGHPDRHLADHYFSGGHVNNTNMESLKKNLVNDTIHDPQIANAYVHIDAPRQRVLPVNGPVPFSRHHLDRLNSP